MKTAYEELLERFDTVITLGSISAHLTKDMEVDFPKNSASLRDKQIATQAMEIHAKMTDPEMERLLDEAEANAASLSPEDRRNLQLMRRDWVYAAGLSAELVKEHAQISTEGERLHTKWRKSGDWSKMRDWYKKTFDFAKKVCTIRKDLLGVSTVYDAALDGFSPGLADASITREFGVLETAIPKLIKEVQELQAKKPKAIELDGEFPREQQLELCRTIVTAMGFDFDSGRMSMIDAHPSCGGFPGYVWFTTGFRTDDFLDALYSTIHEAGHGIYEQNLPEKWRFQPAGAAAGMSVHESQSRIMEVQATHTPEFFRYLEKEARRIFKRPDDPALSAENLERLINRANPSFIRTEADELTYSTHVIVRHKIEKAMLQGEMTIDELPQAWNDGIQKLLGITPPGPAQGHMQDVHWPVAYIGYFPAYTLGDMIAAQLFAKACKDHPELKSELEKGNFAPLTNWLKKNVHSKGSLLTTNELLKQATGEELNAKYYLDHLSQRYLGKPWEQEVDAKPAVKAPKQNIR